MMKHPMLAASECVNEQHLQQLQYPMLVSRKIDGVRVITSVNSKGVRAFSRSGKLINNIFVQDFMSGCIPFLDGEFVMLDANKDMCPLHVTNSFVSSEMMFLKDFTYFLFDHTGYATRSFEKRQKILRQQVDRYMSDLKHIIILEQKMMHKPDDVLAEFHLATSEGYEGLILRDPKSEYKHGRATFASCEMLKMKNRETDFARIVSLVPWQKNSAVSEPNEVGMAKKTKKKGDLVDMPYMGAFIVESERWGQFSIGSGKGLDLAYRGALWDMRHRLRGRLVHFSYHAFGTKDSPREPIFLKLCDKDQPNDPL